MSESEQPKPAFGVGSFLWHELKSRDLEKAKDFYAKVAGWSYDEMDMGPAGKYTMIKAGDKNVGGAMPMDGPEWGEMPSHWSYYIDVEDVEATAAKVAELGGEKKFDMIEVPDVGKFMPISAPDGSHVYIMTPANRAAEPPCPDPGHFIWVELMSRDWDKAKEFYSKLVGWDTQEMPMPDGTVYNLLIANGAMAGGGMAMPKEVPAEVPSHWGGYIHVPDVDAALKAAQENGGNVVMPAMDVEGVGRMAHIVDPAGATVAVMTPAQG